MSLQLPRSLHRGLALGLLAAVPLIIYIAIWAPLYNRVTVLREEITAQRVILGRLLAAVPAEQNLRAEEHDAQHIEASMFLPGSSDAMRIAELQSRLGKLAEAEGITIKSARAVQPHERDGVQFLGVEVQFNATNEQLQKLLLAIDANRPYLLIESIQIAAQGFVSRPDDDRLSELDVSISVGGAVQRVKG